MISRPVPVTDPHHRPAPVTHGPDDVALVFESGGMRGAYTAGLVRVMLEAGLSFPWVGGISAGCTNTCNFVSRDTWRTREAYLGLTTDPQAGGWGSFVTGKGYFNSEHIYLHTSAPDESIPFDWETFAASKMYYQRTLVFPLARTGNFVGHISDLSVSNYAEKY